MLRFRGLVLAAAALVFAGVLWLAGGLGNEFLPQVDDGRIRVWVRMPPETPVEVTDRASRAAEAVVGDLPEVVRVFATAGGSAWGRGIFYNPTVASMVVELAPRRQRSLSATEWIQMAQKRLQALPELADARVRLSPPRIRGLRTSTSAEDIEVKVFGDDIPTLERIGHQLVRELSKLPGLANVDTSYQQTSPEIRVELDRVRAADLGLDVGEVGRTVRTAVGGFVATRLTEGDREYDVRVRFDRALVTSAADLAMLPLFPRSGAPIRLRDVADIREGASPQTIQRENQNRLVRVSGQALPGVWSTDEAMAAIRERLADFPLPEGYHMRFGGQEEAIRENRRVLLTVIGLAVFLVFAVMAVQYESLVNPLVIMAAIPLAFIGVVAALKLTGLPMSAPVMLGMILLAGIVVNNGILLVEYIELYRRGGRLARWEAILEAAPLRVRPIAMTVTTTVIGMLPLALNPAEGGELMTPLAVSVIGGLLVSTALTLFVVPATYLTLTTFADAVAQRLLRAPHPEVAPSGGQAGSGVGEQVP